MSIDGDSTPASVNTNPQQPGGGGMATNSAPPSVPTTTTAATTPDQQHLYDLVVQLTIQDKREHALSELSKYREKYPDLAQTLWYSVGCISALLQEIISVYPHLSPATLTAPAANRVCNALALLQCVAGHEETKSMFLKAHIALFLYPFLNTMFTSRPFEYLRLTSLGVIGALVKVDDVDAVRFLLSTEIIPLCLRIMERGTELAKTVATFIVQKILLFDIGLSYFCVTPQRFFAISTVLRNMLTDKPSLRLLKHIIRCYLRLSDHTKARDMLRQNKFLPDCLRDNTFSKMLEEDPTLKRWLVQLLANVGETTVKI